MDKYTTDGSEIPLRSAQMLNQQDETIAALRAEKDGLERGVLAQGAVIDALRAENEKYRLGMQENCALRARVAELVFERNCHEQWADYYRARWLGETVVRRPDVPRYVLGKPPKPPEGE